MVTRGHVNLKWPLLVELSSHESAGGGEKNNKEKNNGVQMQTETHQMVSFESTHVDVDLTSEAGIENEDGQKVSVLYVESRTDS